MAPLADAVMVIVGVTDVASTAPMDGDGVDISCGDRLSPGVWCRGRTLIRNDLHSQFVNSVRCDPIGTSSNIPPSGPAGPALDLVVWTDVSSYG